MTMQLRIKKVIYTDGRVRYYPQRRHWLYTCMFWCNFKGFTGYDECGPKKFIEEKDCIIFLETYIASLTYNTVKVISFKPYP